MDRIDQIKICITEFYSGQTPENFKQIHDFLINWENSDLVVQDCIQLLSKETNEAVLFHASRSLCDFLRKRTRNLFNEQQIIEIGNFVSELVLQYISNDSEQSPELSEDSSINPVPLLDRTYFKFFLNCIADSCAFSKGGLLLKDACFRFPIDISLHICMFFFEDWNEHINEKWPVESDDIEFTLGILREVPVSVEWLSLYSSFSEYKPDQIDILSEFFPQLHEVLNLTDSYYYLIDHIETILSLSFNSYTMIIMQLSLEFSRHLRELIDDCLEKDDIDSIREYSNHLTLLWSFLFSFQDETESFFSEDVPLFLDLLKEFTIVQPVLMAVVQKTEDIELWPELIESMIIFSKVFNEAEPHQHYTVDIIEFILFAGSIGVELTESGTQESLFDFYINNTDEINNYLMDPNQNVPVILTFLSIIAKGIEKREKESGKLSEEDILPIDIPLVYLENIEMFQSSPKDVIYFALTFVDSLGKDEDCIQKFCQLFCLHFKLMPYECAEGFYKISNINRKVYFDFEIPQLLFDNFEKVSFFEENNNDQEQKSNWAGELFLSKSPLIYMLPCIINDQIDMIINDPQYTEGDKSEVNEMEVRLMTQLNGIASNIFDNLMKGLKMSEHQFLLFLSVISSAFIHIKTDDEASLKNDIIKRFCLLIFQQTMEMSQHLWLNQSSYIQNSLAYFVKSAFSNDFVGDSTQAVVSWLDNIVAIAPVNLHFEIPMFVHQYFKDMTNLQMVIQCCVISPEDPESNQDSYEINQKVMEFALTCLKTFVNNFKVWEDSFFILFPPQLLLLLATNIEGTDIIWIYSALNKIIESEKADSEMIEQLLLIALNEYKKNRCGVMNLSMIRKIFEIVGGENLVQACTSLEFTEANIKELIKDLNDSS